VSKKAAPKIGCAAPKCQKTAPKTGCAALKLPKKGASSETFKNQKFPGPKKGGDVNTKKCSFARGRCQILTPGLF